MLPFVPADHAPALRLLSDAFPRLPPSLARAAIEAYTRPGELILDPFCVGTSVIESALVLGRKVIAASFNPINLLAIEATLFPADARAALTHLADAPKGSARLIDHIDDAYRARCPTCGREATALAFEWERDQQIPVEKRVACVVCGENLGPGDADDAARAGRFKARGLPFWALHSRVIDPRHEEADRVGDVLDAYTPRAQAVLNDILLKFDGLPDVERAALRPALLAALDAATSLHAPNETHRLIGLNPPPRYVERNVWHVLEQYVSEQIAPPATVPRAVTLDAVLNSAAPALALVAAPVRDLVKQLPPQSVALTVTHPPLPRPGFWSLSTAWTAWLWGRKAAEALWPLLSRKRTNWDWQWRASASALGALATVQRAGARIVMAFAYDDTVAESVTLAAAAAELVTEQLACDPHDGVQAGWRVGAPVEIRDIADRAEQVLRERAEPTAWPVLHTALLGELGRGAWLRALIKRGEAEAAPLAGLRDALRTALAAPRLVELDDHKWWLTGGPAAAAQTDQPPLADRVEEAVCTLLRSQAVWSIADLLLAIYQLFPDHLTPDRALTATCIQSYAEELPDQRVRLRAEDAAEARAAEIREMTETLGRLGERLGCEVSEAGERLSWRRAGRVVHEFAVSAAAAVAPLLREPDAVLVIPGGRATLLQLKIARDPRLRVLPWRVLKFSAARRIVAQGELSLATFQQAFGLEPPIERPQRQLGLWGDGYSGGSTWMVM